MSFNQKPKMNLPTNTQICLEMHCGGDPLERQGKASSVRCNLLRGLIFRGLSLPGNQTFVGQHFLGGHNFQNGNIFRRPKFQVQNFQSVNIFFPVMLPSFGTSEITKYLPSQLQLTDFWQWHVPKFLQFTLVRKYDNYLLSQHPLVLPPPYELTY